MPGKPLETRSLRLPSTLVLSRGDEWRFDKATLCNSTKFMWSFV